MRTGVNRTQSDVDAPGRSGRLIEQSVSPDGSFDRLVAKACSAASGQCPTGRGGAQKYSGGPTGNHGGVVWPRFIRRGAVDFDRV
jgi:hypothetical protein